MGSHKGILDALDALCKRSNSRTLRQLGLGIGASTGSTKNEMRIRLINQARTLDILRSRRLDEGSLSIMGIDAGVSNFSLAKFCWPTDSRLPSLTGWDKFQLEQKFLSDKEPAVLSLHPHEITTVCGQLVQTLDQEFGIPNLYAIERQRARTMSSKSVLEPVLKSNILEHVLFATLFNRRQYSATLPRMEYNVESSDPGRMTSYWMELPSMQGIKAEFQDNLKLEQTKLSGKNSKLLRINIVKRIIDAAVFNKDVPERLIDLEPKLRNRLLDRITTDTNDYKLFDVLQLSPEQAGAKKDDDLADSFLHGLAWVQWLRTYNDLYALAIKDLDSINLDDLRISTNDQD
ncbi:hypothetical protein Kpol_1057p1 [Vanderwaltozyma polyspora DSM 70294]|uniref:Mitochondrial resolvase Ydc2 catalytic domain-containing protein n=1 Tax=Vanderwaltozyma polyspora (strain ATCC 22028 / DSM 70294 / BCRC 21397 / CBS 2163 / NBRC 10782 / NRRL Y-8283 / UCD 57-17) TaxID=436907 RepID=A7TPG9_VANPO|nr:uncharacterized protein Kpol_1057p1 [Vanderwaltozyma polyspora DSM 70294]EDO15813.1 hypothetical protein Kpol_1057p1 [Vanderwaltozyma polyspora DSM 70294]